LIFLTSEVSFTCPPIAALKALAGGENHHPALYARDNITKKIFLQLFL